MCCMFWLFFSVLELTPIQSSLMTIMCMIIGLMSLTLYSIRKQSVQTFLPMLYIVCFFFLGIQSNIYTNNRTIIQLLYMIFFSGVGFSLYYSRRSFNYLALFRLSFALYIIGTVFGYLGRGAILGKGSISIDIFFLMIYILLAMNKSDKYESISPVYSFMGLLVCLLCAKRMGIVVWAIVLLVTIGLDCSNGKIRLRKTFFIYAVLVIVSLCIMYQYGLGLELLLDRISTEGVSVDVVNKERDVIWEEYLNSTNNIIRIFWGTPFDNLFFANIYSGNLHNSFLECHAIYGLGGMVVFSIICFFISRGLLRKKEYYLFFLFVILLLRSLTDYLFFGNYCDALIVCYFIKALEGKKYIEYSPKI